MQVLLAASQVPASVLVSNQNSFRTSSQEKGLTQSLHLRELQCPCPQHPTETCATVAAFAKPPLVSEHEALDLELAD